MTEVSDNPGVTFGGHSRTSGSDTVCCWSCTLLSLSFGVWEEYLLLLGRQAGPCQYVAPVNLTVQRPFEYIGDAESELVMTCLHPCRSLR